MKCFSRIVLLLLISCVLTGCATITLVNSLKDPGVPSKQYKKLLVVGLSAKIEMRQIFEEVFSAEVTKQGVTGIASYTITGVKDKPSRASLVEAVKKSGVDGVITTRLVGIKKDSNVHTGYIMTDHGIANPYGVRVSYTEFVHQPVEVILSSEAAIETNLFDGETGNLIWSGTSSVVNPEGIINITKELADKVIKAMVRDGLI
jgi:hypothetical protein